MLRPIASGQGPSHSAQGIQLAPTTYSLLLVGDGPLRDELQQVASDLGVADRTVFVGALDNPYPLMQRADVIALVSAEEGFGLVALEAAALNVPFVGSDVGGLGELCGVLGCETFPPGQARALAAAILRLTSGAGWRATQDRLNRFDVGQVAGDYLSLAGLWCRPEPARQEKEGG